MTEKIIVTWLIVGISLFSLIISPWKQVPVNRRNLEEVQEVPAAFWFLETFSCSIAFLTSRTEAVCEAGDG